IAGLLQKPVKWKIDPTRVAEPALEFLTRRWNGRKRNPHPRRTALMLAADMAGRPPKTPAPPFGRRISTLRKERGLSQEQFARLLGTTRGMVEYYERRARNPSLEVVQQVAQVLGATVAELAGEDSQKKPRTHPGPISKLEERFEQIRRLPRRQQAFILKII